MQNILRLLVVGAALGTMADNRVTGQLDGQILATGSGRVVMLDGSGNELWSFKGANVADVSLVGSGNVLFADNDAKEVDPKTSQIVWSYKSEFGKGGGVFSAQRLANGVTVVGENSTGRILEVDQAGKITFELQLPDVERGSHNNLRHCRKLASGNYLVTYKALQAVREYTRAGELVMEIKTPNAAFSAVRLPRGHTLVGHINGVTEYDGESKAVWSFGVSDLPEGLKIGMICGVHALPNGNVLCGIYSVPVTEAKGVGLLEITRDKKIVWRYLGPDKNMMAAQKLSLDGKPLPGEALR
ncbi:MAG: hypothetical protein PHO37_16305 [Kiritimatiellae bacterium]|nr:hypothetical protein [Kiritimatiellia bacterium]